MSAAISGVPGHDKVAVDRIARKTAGYSGADMRALAGWVNNAALSKALAEAAETAGYDGAVRPRSKSLRALNSLPGLRRPRLC